MLYFYCIYTRNFPHKANLHCYNNNQRRFLWQFQLKSLLTPKQKNQYRKAKKAVKSQWPWEVKTDCKVKTSKNIEKTQTCPCGIENCDCNGDCDCTEVKPNSSSCPCGIESCDCVDDCDCDKATTETTTPDTNACPCGIADCECKKCTCTQCMCDETDNCGCKEPCTCE